MFPLSVSTANSAPKSACAQHPCSCPDSTFQLQLQHDTQAVSYGAGFDNQLSSATSRDEHHGRWGSVALENAQCFELESLGLSLA